MTSIPITIHNLRMGFATNSSSTHSLILIPGGAEDSDCRGGEFGWQFFTAGSRSFKNLYTALQLRSAINSQSGPRIAQSVAEHLCREFGMVRVQDNHIQKQTVSEGEKQC